MSDKFIVSVNQSNTYYISRNKKQDGPYSVQQIVQMLERSTLKLTDFIYDPTQGDWVLLMAHAEVNAYLYSEKPTAPPNSASAVIAPNGNEQSPYTAENQQRSNYKKRLIDEVRQELGPKVDMAKYSDELISGPITPSHFNDLIDAPLEDDEVLPLEDQTREVPFEDEDPTQEIDVDCVESTDKTELKVKQNLQQLMKNRIDKADEQLALYSESCEEDDNTKEIPVEIINIISSPDAELPLVEESSPSISSQEDLGMVSESKLGKAPSLSNTGSSLKGVFEAVPDCTYQEKIDEIKKGTGSLKEKALKITKALEEVSDPLLSEWYILKDHNKYGPYTYKDMLNMLDDKFIYGFDFVWHKSLSNWRRLADLEAFSFEMMKKLKNTLMPELSKLYKKRRHKRVNFGHSIMIHDNSKVWKGTSVTISESGVEVIMEQAHIKKGQTLYLHFKPGDGVPPFNAACEVVTKQPKQNLDTQKLEIYYGMKFLKITNDVGHLVSSIAKKKKAIS